MEVKRTDDIEDQWAFLEKELENFQTIMAELEAEGKKQDLKFFQSLPAKHNTSQD
jgi:hypothetical protein